VPEGLLITPAGGAPEVTYLATFMIGQELGVVALYDSDAQGSAARDKLVKNWLTRYNSSRATALSLGEVLGLPERGVTIEDVFTEKFYLEHVHSVYERQLAATAVKEVKLPAGDQLCKRTEAFFDSLNIKFNKGSVAKAICASIRKMRTIDELPKEAALKAQLLIESITKAAAAPQGKGAGGPST